MPDEVEEMIAGAVASGEIDAFAESILAVEDGALGFLRSFATQARPAVGPVSAGTLQVLRREATWKVVAARYLAAFEGGERVYPYIESV